MRNPRGNPGYRPGTPVVRVEPVPLAGKGQSRFLFLFFTSCYLRLHAQYFVLNITIFETISLVS